MRKRFFCYYDKIHGIKLCVGYKFIIVFFYYFSIKKIDRFYIHFYIFYFELRSLEKINRN